MKQQTAIIDDIEQTVKSRWYDITPREGVSENDCETISPVLVYEGFRLPVAK